MVHTVHARYANMLLLKLLQSVTYGVERLPNFVEIGSDSVIADSRFYFNVKHNTSEFNTFPQAMRKYTIILRNSNTLITRFVISNLIVCSNFSYPEIVQMFPMQPRLLGQPNLHTKLIAFGKMF